MCKVVVIDIKISEPSCIRYDVSIPERVGALIHDEVRITVQKEFVETCTICNHLVEKYTYFCEGPENRVSGLSEVSAITAYVESVILRQLITRGFTR